MKIADIVIEPPVILAPMAGVTDLPYRQVVSEVGGCGLVCTEMVSAKGLVHGNERTEKLLEISNNQQPVSLQLFGNDPQTLAQAAKRVVEISNPEIIDLNVGCPTPKIVKNGYGSALMKEPYLLGEIVKAMDKAVEIPVTIKIRTGWDGERINACQIAKIAQENGAAAIGVHGRTREQFYQGQADWEIIKEVKETVSIPVIGNGDIFKPEDAIEMIDQTGCDAVMIARGAQGNPWIFARTAHYLKIGELLPPPSPQEKIDKTIYHLEKLVDYKGEYVGIREMRKHASWYLKGLRNCTAIKDKINQTQSKEEMKELLIKYQAQFS
ncbi:putative TIM-barrel protein, nifR3 family [Halobacteroides halobius DSM 5150]|uniref:tRNA-dihydrouridine synthase n=1 Tax=Halobacteroides halobius (strain ATCC 35273 / DSM 5150 / MD-1) TaxID=748449 RepID=L0K7Q4_HALHC|nr:tRNA dihydrouridine synthase DusB [Halobacteroides halobius]AGB40158.1 putative TIM-barrel protein, nifR3 family [Halobacteroides halobius DSM 5150]